MPHFDGLYYESIGSGPPLYVMHGGMGFDHTYLRGGLTPLADEFEIVFYDHRGNGRSAEPEDWDLVSHEMWAEDAERLREHLGHERIMLLGSSYGGFLALEYAIRFPERTAALVIAGAGLGLPQPEVLMANARARANDEQFAALTKGFTADFEGDDGMAKILRTVLPIYSARPDGEAIFSAFDNVRYSKAAFLTANGRCLPQFDIEDRLRTLNVSCLIVVGREDWIAPPHLTPSLLEQALPGATMMVFEKSGHFPFIDEPDAFVALVRTWLNDQLTEG
jgi:proline iminopeptidase